ncbi:MAG: KOW domain-containing RNA-binding protein [Clostridia bacterium]|nr:KOW domain-containing RNA-binding protein [Clostridia bacterium]
MSPLKRIPIEPGRVVVSRAGRDAKRAMVVLALDGEEHALVADGRLRMVAKPKRKKFKHLTAKPVCIDGIQEKLTKSGTLDAEIRTALELAGYGPLQRPNKEGCEIGKE